MLGKRKTKKTSQPHSYWQSYSDMMAALLLMFVLIMAFTLAQSLKTYEEKIRIQDEQQKILTEQQALLEEQQRQIDELIGVKTDIIRALNLTFKDSNLRIDIDAQTGAISLDSSILFGFNSADLSDDGVDFLEEFLPLYLSVLLSDEFRPFISEIIIEGHTDTLGSYMYNLNLSQERAYSVASYCLDEDASFLPESQCIELRGIITANGRSFSSPIYNSDGSVNADKSRRVEIKFRLQDDEMINQLRNILEGKM